MMRRVLSLLSLLVIVGGVSLSRAQARQPADGRAGRALSWVSRGIGGGGAFFSPSISPFDSDRLFLATDMSAVYESRNFGRKWTMAGFSGLQGGIDSTVRFTSDPEILYAIHLPGDARVPVKSTDGGATWVPLPGDPTWAECYSLWVDPASTQRLLLSSYSALYFSSDGGANFDEVYAVDDFHVSGVFFDGERIFVGSRVGLLLSTDGGASFLPAAVGGIGEGEAMVSFAGARAGTTVRLWCVTLGDGDVWPLVTGAELENYRNVYTMDWGQGTWSGVGASIDTDICPFFVAATPTNTDIVWLAGGDPSRGSPVVLRSTDGGQSWNSVLDTVNNGNVVTGWAGDGGDTSWWWGEFALGLAVCPTDPDTAVLTDLGFVHVTSDGGDSWRQAYVSEEDDHPAGQSTPLGENYHGIGLEDSGCWWLTWADETTILASLTDIRGIRSDDGGSSWISGFSYGLPHNTTYMTVRHPLTGALYGATSSIHDMYQSTYLADQLIDGGEGSIIISTDRGRSFAVLHNFGHPVVWLALDPHDADTLYASVVHSTEGGIYVTHDLSSGSAAAWTRLAAPPRTSGHPFSIIVLDDGTLLCSYSGHMDASGAFMTASGVFLSTDGGASWSDRSDTGMLRWTKDLIVDPHDPSQDTWFAAVFSHWGSAPNEVGGLYRTTDRGLHWVRIVDSYRVESLSIDPRNPSSAWITTETDGLWYSGNFGTETPEFILDTAYPFSHPVRVFFNPHDPTDLWVTSFGGGLFEMRRPLFADGFESGDPGAWSVGP